MVFSRTANLKLPRKKSVFILFTVQYINFVYAFQRRSSKTVQRLQCIVPGEQKRLIVL